MKNTFRFIRMMSLTLALSGTAQLACAETVVIVAAANPTTTLTADQVSDLFLGRANNFPGGGSATPVDQTDGSAVREDFYTKVANKSAAQIKAYWAKLVFTGKGQPPKEAGDNSGVKSAVAGNPSAIGYIDKSAVDASVKVVFSAR